MITEVLRPLELDSESCLGGQVPAGLHEGLFFDVGQDDLHLLLRATFGQRATDAAGCPCHDGNFSLEFFHDAFLFRSFYVNAEQQH